MILDKLIDDEKKKEFLLGEFTCYYDISDIGITLNEAENLAADYKETFIVYINTGDEGSIPHIHISSTSIKNKRHDRKEKKTDIITAIQIDKCEYFLHGKYQSILNSAQRKALDRLLSQPAAAKYQNKYGKISIWQLAQMKI